MTRPITDKSIRERLARWLHKHDRELVAKSDRWPSWDEADRGIQDIYLSRIDAILAELENPSEGMLEAAQEYPYGGETRQAWQAMIQHIRDGGS